MRLSQSLNKWGALLPGTARLDQSLAAPQHSGGPLAEGSRMSKLSDIFGRRDRRHAAYTRIGDSSTPPGEQHRLQLFSGESLAPGAAAAMPGDPAPRRLFFVKNQDCFGKVG
jgi:hypothetical protein